MINSLNNCSIHDPDGSLFFKSKISYNVFHIHKICNKSFDMTMEYMISQVYHEDAIH